MKKSKVIILSVLLFAMLALTSTLIAAWLTDTKSTSSTTFTVGDVKLPERRDDFRGCPIVPGQNLIGSKFYLANASTVDAN